jgi:hypothetical protein
MAKIPRLTNMLSSSPYFTDPSVEDYIPIDKQEIYLKLASVFQSKISYLYSDPEELARPQDYDGTGIGTPELWDEFLTLDTVQLYITARTRNLASQKARKSLHNLQKQADKGDVQAIKYLNEVSGMLAGADNNKTIVLLRPKTGGEMM